MNVLICALDSPGFLYQSIGLAKVLEQGGHRVACVSSASVADVFERYGVTRIPRPGTDGPSFVIAKWGTVEATLLQFLHVMHAAKSVRPDVIVASALGKGPALAAERLGVPLVTIGGLTFLWEPGSWRHDESWTSFLAARRALRLPLPSEAARREFPPWLGGSFLLQSSASLTGPLRWPQCSWVGDASWDPPSRDDGLSSWLDATARRGRRIVYLQTGREFGRRSVLDMLEEPARRLDLAFVVATAHSDRERTRTEDSLWARPFVPRAAVLPRCSLVVGAGHPTTVLGALTHGRPLVLLSNGSGTEESAEACQRAGVAITARLTEATPSGLGALLTRAFGDEAMRRAAAAIGADLRSRGGLATVAGIVAGANPSSMRATV